MDVRQLRYALLLAEHQHFGRAAAAAGIAQPPLSRSIALLEREIGVKLFDRTRDGVFPTAAGDALLERARRIDRELIATAHDARRAARGETGSLRIAFIASALLSMLPAVLRSFRAEHPEVRLQVEEMTTVESTGALAAGEVDAIVCRGAPRGRGADRIVSVQVSRDYLAGVVSTSHPLAGQKRVGLDQLQGQPLITVLPDGEPAIAKALNDTFPGFPARPGVIQTSDTQTIIGLAACGFGIGLGPQDMRTTARADTWIFDMHPKTPLPSLRLAFRDDRQSPSLSALLGVVARTCPTARPELARLRRQLSQSGNVPRLSTSP